MQEGAGAHALARGHHLVSIILVVIVTACSPMEGPTIVIDASGWSAIPERMVQPGNQYVLRVVNTTDSPVSPVVVRMFSGDVRDIPLINGVIVDVENGTADGLHEVHQPAPGLEYRMFYPDLEDIAAGRPLAPLEPGDELRVVVGGSFGLGGGEPGTYAVISNDPGGLKRGDFAVFELTAPGG